MNFLKNNKLIIFLLFAVIGTGTLLTLVSQNVYDTQKSVQTKSRDLVSEQWELRSLKAELAYLSRPDRLDHLFEASSQIGTEPTIVQILQSQNTLNMAPVSYVPVPPLKPLGRSPIHLTQPSASHPQTQSDFSSLLQSIGGER
jgi:hypothetical protein